MGSALGEEQIWGCLPSSGHDEGLHPNQRMLWGSWGAHLWSKASPGWALKFEAGRSCSLLWQHRRCVFFFFPSNSHWGCSQRCSHSSRVWAAPKQLHRAEHGSFSFLPVPSGLWEPTRMGQLQAAHKRWEISPNSLIPPAIPKGNGAVGTAGSILMQHILQCFSVWCCI